MDHTSDKAWFRSEFMIEANTSNSLNFANSPNGVSNDQYRVREAFVQGGNILAAQPNAKFWAGERYYRRQHIDSDDFFSLDMSGYGAGVEDIDAKFGKMAVAFLGVANPEAVTQNGNLATRNIDVRLYDVKGPFGLWGGWFDYATSKGGVLSSDTKPGSAPDIRLPSESGYAYGIRHQKLEWHGGYHTFMVQYGTGAASNFSGPGVGMTDPSPDPNRTKSKSFWSPSKSFCSPTTGLP